MTNFDRFTERARKALELAQEEARQFGHDHLGTEHLLLGLIREKDGVAARSLSALGIKRAKARSEVSRIFGQGDRAVEHLRLTPRAKTVLALAIEESRQLQHDHVGTEHLLLGLIDDTECIANSVIKSQGVKPDDLRAKVLELLGIPPDPPPEHA